MNIDEKILKRFDELINRIEKLISERSISPSLQILDDYAEFESHDASYTVDVQGAIQWQIGCLHLLSKVFGGDSDFYSEFKDRTRQISSEDNYQYIVNALGVLKAAKDDYKDGFLFNTRTLIEAEIFSDIIEQAEELLKKNHFQAAAVIIGCVLEDGLRKLCNKNKITFSKKPTIEPMNVELAKIGLYNQFIKDKVSSIGKLRNHAAHGE